MDKKGSIGDVFYIAVFLFVCAITFIVSWVTFGSINTSMQEQPAISDSGKTIMSNSFNNYVGWLDSVFFTVMIVLWLATMILAWQIDTYPVFYVLTIIAAVMLVIITSALGNTFYNVAAADGISNYADDFVIIPFVMNNYVVVMLGLLFSVAVVMYAKAQGG